MSMRPAARRTRFLRSSSFKTYGKLKPSRAVGAGWRSVSEHYGANPDERNQQRGWRFGRDALPGALVKNVDPWTKSHSHCH